MHITLKSARDPQARDLDSIIRMGHWKQAMARDGLRIAIASNDFAPVVRPGDHLVVKQPANLSRGDLTMVLADGRIQFLRVLRSPTVPHRVEVMTSLGALELPMLNVFGKVTELKRYGEPVEMARGFAANLRTAVQKLRAQFAGVNT